MRSFVCWYLVYVQWTAQITTIKCKYALSGIGRAEKHPQKIEVGIFQEIVKLEYIHRILFYIFWKT